MSVRYLNKGRLSGENKFRILGSAEGEHGSMAYDGYLNYKTGLFRLYPRETIGYTSIPFRVVSVPERDVEHAVLAAQREAQKMPKPTQKKPPKKSAERKEFQIKLFP